MAGEIHMDGQRPTKTKRLRKRIEPAWEWVQLDRVAALFDVSPDFIRQRSIDLNIRTQLIGSELRAWWPDAIALRDRMLKKASADDGYADKVIDIERARRA
jgi:hypothetical protein